MAKSYDATEQLYRVWVRYQNNQDGGTVEQVFGFWKGRTQARNYEKRMLKEEADRIKQSQSHPPYTGYNGQKAYIYGHLAPGVPRLKILDTEVQFVDTQDWKKS